MGGLPIYPPSRPAATPLCILCCMVLKDESSSRALSRAGAGHVRGSGTALCTDVPCPFLGHGLGCSWPHLQGKQACDVGL